MFVVSAGDTAIVSYRVEGVGAGAAAQGGPPCVTLKSIGITITLMPQSK